MILQNILSKAVVAVSFTNQIQQFLMLNNYSRQYEPISGSTAFQYNQKTMFRIVSISSPSLRILEVKVNQDLVGGFNPFEKY